MNKMIIGLCGPAGSGKDTIADHLVKKHRFMKMANADLLKRMAQLAFDFTDEQLWGPSELRNAPDKRYPRQHGPFTQDNKCACCGVQGVKIHEWTEDRSEELIKAPDACYLTPRFALQSLGTEWGRMCFENLWVSRLLGTAQDLLSSKGHRWYTAKEGIAWLHPEDTLEKPLAGVVITDVRFLNEVDAIHAAGGKIVRIVRGIVNTFDQYPADGGWITEIKRGDMGPSVILQEQTSVSYAAAQHRSEMELLTIPKEKFDYILHNSGDLQFLGLQADRLLDVFKGKIMAFDRGLQDAPPFLREKCKTLAAFMCELSQKHFGTEWHEETSFRLWYALQNGGELGFADADSEGKYLDEVDFGKLGELHDAVNGWFSWSDKTYDAPYFVRRSAWLAEYEKRSR